MSKNNIEKLIKVIEDNRETIIEASKECYKDSISKGFFQGWNVGIIADIKGNIYDYYWSNGTSNFDIYNGEAIRVVNYTTQGCYEGEIVINDTNLTEKQQEDFKKFLLNNEYITLKELDNWRENLTYDYISKFDSDIITNITNECIDWETDEYYREKANNAIDYTLEQLNLQLEYELEEIMAL